VLLDLKYQPLTRGIRLASCQSNYTCRHRDTTQVDEVAIALDPENADRMAAAAQGLQEPAVTA
jgi:hypothetical protein